MSLCCVSISGQDGRTTPTWQPLRSTVEPHGQCFFARNQYVEATKGTVKAQRVIFEDLLCGHIQFQTHLTSHSLEWEIIIIIIIMSLTPVSSSYEDIGGVPSLQSCYSAGMKRCGICMEERSPLWVRRSKSKETLCRLLITMVEETFDIRDSLKLSCCSCFYTIIYFFKPFMDKTIKSKTDALINTTINTM